MFRSPVIAMATLCLLSCSRFGEEEIAGFSGGAIHADQFAARFHQYLQTTGSRDNILLREEILNNMVNEQLILAELDRQGFASLPETAEFLERARTQALLDRYANAAGADSVVVTELDYQREFRSYNTKATARYLYAASESEAWALKRRLDEGAEFSELARECFRDPGLATNGGFLGTFGYGEMEPGLEQVAFSLPLGTVSDPFPMRAGYGLLMVESRTVNPLLNQSDFSKVKQELHHTIAHRKAAVALTNLSVRIVDDLAARFDADAVRLVFDSWKDLFSGSRENGLPDRVAGMSLVTFNGGEWTVGQFIDKARMTSERQRNRVRGLSDVEDVVNGLLVRDELLRRAVAEGLQNDPEVTKQVDLQFLNHQLTSWKAGLIADAEAEIDDALLMREYDSRPELHTYPPQVNVSEVLVRTMKEAEEIAARARAGVDFRELAKRYSLRLWAAEQGGELGYGSGADFGPLAGTFLDAEVGTILGPESVDPYFAVFKVIGKKTGLPRSFEEAREEIRKSLAAARSQSALTAALAKLRRDAHVRVNVDALATIQIDHHAGDQES